MSVCAEALEKIFEECANVPCAARSTRPQSIVVSTSSLSTAAGFIALKDAPGPCPGPGWQLIASQGKRGAAGEKGERGPPGPQGDPGASGATILGWKIDRTRYVATPVMSDGREGPPLELRGLFLGAGDSLLELGHENRQMLALSDAALARLAIAPPLCLRRGAVPCSGAWRPTEGGLL